MIIIAKTSNVTVAPRKLQLLAKAIKTMTPTDAVEQLGYLNRSASRPLLKVIKQALANAKNNFALSEKNLRFFSIEVGHGITYHRAHPASRGRSKPYDLMRSHITVKLLSPDPVAAPAPKAAPAKLEAPKTAKKITKTVTTKKTK